MKLTIRLSPELPSSDVALIRFEPGNPAELDVDALVVEWNPPADERASDEHLQELVERLETERADFAELERTVDKARERLAELLEIDLELFHAPSLETAVEQIADTLSRRLDVEAWPTVVNLIRKLRSREHPRDRQPGDPSDYAVVFDSKDWESAPDATVSFSHDHRDGSRTFTLSELPSRPFRRVVDRPQS